MVVAFAAKPQPHVREVLLLDVGLVILAIRARAGERHRLGASGAVAHELVVDELAAVVAVEPAQWEGQAGGDIVHLPANTGFAAVGPAAQHAPGGMDVHRVEQPAVPVIERAAAPRHGVHFQVAGSVFGPLGADGNLRAQPAAGPGGGAPPMGHARRD